MNDRDILNMKRFRQLVARTPRKDLNKLVNGYALIHDAAAQADLGVVN